MDVETETPGPDWAAVRTEYEGRVGTLEDLARRWGVTKSAISYRAKKGLWRMRNKAVAASGPTLVARIFRLIERQIFQMEAMVTPMGESEAVILGRVATTIERLMEIDDKERTKRPARRAESKDLQEVRKKIAARLDQLNRG